MRIEIVVEYLLIEQYRQPTLYNVFISIWFQEGIMSSVFSGTASRALRNVKKIGSSLGPPSPKRKVRILVIPINMRMLSSSLGTKPNQR
jgi:hypothetical protein